MRANPLPLQTGVYFGMGESERFIIDLLVVDDREFAIGFHLEAVVVAIIGDRRVTRRIADRVHTVSELRYGIYPKVTALVQRLGYFRPTLSLTSAMNRLDRLTAILIHLQTKRVVRAQELANRLATVTLGDRSSRCS